MSDAPAIRIVSRFATALAERAKPGEKAARRTAAGAE
jgi:hypothetical protein